MARNYDSTVARIAGNLLSGAAWSHWWNGNTRYEAVARAVATARDIIEETKRTEPVENKDGTP